MISFELTSFLQSLTRKDRVEAAARSALEAEAEKLVEAIREAAPADSGHLRDSVRQEPGDEPLSVLILAGGTPETTKTSAAGTFDEALMLEYGTSRTDAQPFFYPTIEKMRDTIKANIGDAANEATKG